MGIRDLFSKREARKRKQGQEDVFQYDTLPEQFRAQVIHIWRDALGTWHNTDGWYGGSREHPSNVWWAAIYNATLREKGTFRLSGRGESPEGQCSYYLLEAPTVDALDLIELSFGVIDKEVRRLERGYRGSYGLADPDEAIDELNGRFREHAIGYEFVGGEIVRVDSKFVHAQAVKPAVQLLHGAGRAFEGPLEEFLSAHARYRKGEGKEAIADSLKALESTLKAICTVRKWAFDPHKDTASKLLQIVFDNNLVPAWLQSQFTALKSVLEAGVPTLRNKTSGHGQGPVPTTVPGHLVSFVLHLTATNIVFLIESHKAMK